MQQKVYDSKLLWMFHASENKDGSKLTLHN